MAFHPDITRKDDVTLALDAANSAVRIASRQLTRNAGTVEIPNADGTSTIMGVGAGDNGVAQWVGDTTAPGKPLDITAESHNGAVWVSWDGTLDGGIPADFSHVQVTASYDAVSVDMGRLTAAGKVSAAELPAGAEVSITAVAYDDAHAQDGSSAPNVSEVSDVVTVTVQSAVDAAQVQQAQDDAQSAIDKAGQASDTATAAKNTAEGASTNATNASTTATAAKTAADSANSTAASALATAQAAQNDGVTQWVPQYAQNTSPTTAPTSGWSNTPPDWVAGSYIWSRMIVAYGSGDYETTEPVVLTGNTGEHGAKGDPGKDGADGTSVSIKGRVATSANLPSSASNGDGYITEDTGHLWVWGSDGFTDVGKIQGENGLNAYAHKAYANSADGTTDFSTTNGTNRAYMGWYNDNTLADSTDPTKYEWTKVKGSDGVQGVSVATVTPYWALGTAAPAKPAVSTPPSPWVSAEPGYQRNQNLYTTTRFTYDSGAFVYTNVQLDSSYQYSAAAETAAQDALQSATNANTAAQTAQTAATNANNAAASAATKADNASSAATQAQSTAAAANQAATSAQTAANLAIQNAQELVRNGGFETGDLTNFTSARGSVVTDKTHGGKYALKLVLAAGIGNGDINQSPLPLNVPIIPGHIYRFSIWIYKDTANASTVGGFRMTYVKSDGTTVALNDDSVTNAAANAWVNCVWDWTAPDDARYFTQFRFAEAQTATTAPAQNMWFDDFSVKDITEAKAAQAAADNAQTAASAAQDAADNAAAIANAAKAAAQGAQTTADGKNKIFASVAEPSHTGLVPGDLWFQQVAGSTNVTGIQVWNGSKFVDYVLMANKVLVAGSVGTIQLANGAVTADQVTASEALLNKLLVREIQADEIDVGSLAAAIVTSNLFKTSGTSDFTIINDTGVTVYKSGTPYVHLGSDTAYGLQLMNPSIGQLTDVAPMVFGAKYYTSSNQVLLTPAAGQSGWKYFSSYSAFSTPTGRIKISFGFFDSNTSDNAYTNWIDGAVFLFSAPVSSDTTTFPNTQVGVVSPALRAAMGSMGLIPAQSVQIIEGLPVNTPIYPSWAFRALTSGTASHYGQVRDRTIVIESV